MLKLFKKFIRSYTTRNNPEALPLLSETAFSDAEKETKYSRKKRNFKKCGMLAVGPDMQSLFFHYLDTKSKLKFAAVSKNHYSRYHNYIIKSPEIRSQLHQKWNGSQHKQKILLFQQSLPKVPHYIDRSGFKSLGIGVYLVCIGISAGFFLCWFCIYIRS